MGTKPKNTQMSFHKPQKVTPSVPLVILNWSYLLRLRSQPFTAQMISSSSETIKSIISNTCLTKYTKTSHSLYLFLPLHCLFIPPSLLSFPQQGGYRVCIQTSGSKSSDVNGTLTVLLAERGVTEEKQTISNKAACHTGRARDAG